MKRITVIVCLLLSCPLIHANDLFEENRNLKEKLREQEKELQPLHRQNKVLKVKLNALKVTNDLLSGKLKAPPQDTPEGNKVIWDYKLESRREYFGNNGYPEFAKNIQDGKDSVLQIIGEKKKSNCLVKYFSKDDLEKIKGKTVTCSVMIKGENIEGDGAVKFMLMVNSSGKKTLWPDARIGEGNFDWRPVSFKFNVPLDVKSIAMIIGLQGPSGTVCYKDMKVTMQDK